MHKLEELRQTIGIYTEKLSEQRKTSYMGGTAFALEFEDRQFLVIPTLSALKRLGLVYLPLLGPIGLNPNFFIQRPEELGDAGVGIRF